MKLQTKALYNLIRYNEQEGVEPWAVEDLRERGLESLFERLRFLGIHLDRKTFFSFSEASDTPEELVDVLLEDQSNDKLYDEVYLIVFELWRRLCPEKQTVSIFCDELDHRISLYDQNKLESDESIQDSLANLKEVLDENVDAGGDPVETFQAISHFCAHDVEEFLYDYITDLIDSENVIYAVELVEQFFPYLSDPIWFEFLRARILSFTDPRKANLEMARILDEHVDIEIALLFEMLSFLSVSGDHPLFIAVIQKIVSAHLEEEEFQELMEITADYYRRLDRDKVEAAIERIRLKRKGKKGVLNPRDPDLKAFAEALK